MPKSCFRKKIQCYALLQCCLSETHFLMQSLRISSNLQLLGGGGGGIIILIKKLLIGRVRFKFQGCWVVFFSSIKFFIEHFEDTDQTSDLGLR